VVEPSLAAQPVLCDFLKPEPLALLEELESVETPHHRREEIGLRLHQMGDPRRGVGLDVNGAPEIAWVDVPAGRVVLETGERHSFEVRPFRLARYPVTWSQYRVFLNAEDGYRNAYWWEGRPREDDPGGLLWAFDNYPAIRVSWYDAIAYCRWLGGKLGFEVRLPTEWEWQWAAGGVQIYPWPGDWDDRLANSADAGIGRTLAVGLYPPGRSPFDLDDMAGNVREWCLNTYEDPETIYLESKSSSVLRGGSWYHGAVFCRVAHRNWTHPLNRDHFIGFRLCCSSPIE
jgi:formylglycine-generating enzyme required for sulfatase activity